MNVCKDLKIIESVAVEMDPVVEGFAGVLVELVFDGERYAVVETAMGSGNRLLRLYSRSEEFARAIFESELGTGNRLVAWGRGFSDNEDEG